MTDSFGRLPLSVRLGTVFASVCLLVLAVLVALAYFGIGATQREGLDRALVDALAQVGDRSRPLAEIDERELGGVESSEIEIQLLGRSGEVLGSTDEDLRAPLLTREQVSGVLEEGALFADADDGDEMQRVLARPASAGAAQVQVLAVEMDPVQESQEALLGAAGPLAAAVALLAGLTGWFVARRGLAPVTWLTAQVDSLGVRDLSGRLELHRSRDEIARLGQTVNGLLARIEEARRRERQFTADASHELRTPLAILRAEVELARAGVGDDAGLRGSLDSALEECDRLSDLVDDLLEVARADAGGMDRSGLVDVAEVVDALLPRFSVLAANRHVSLSHQGDAAVRADPRALRRALSNMLDNAVRHARTGGAVGLVIVRGRGSVAVTVTDDGPGVAPEDRPRVVQPFAQLHRPGSGSGGAGLGLAMVSSIAAAHEGSLELATPPSGTGLAVTLRLPVAGPDGPVD